MKLSREIIVDNFAGGGGTSTGVFNATGRHVDVAINHSPSAIAMHEANHPETDHYCESVYDVNPVDASKGQPIGLCWLSPDCTHFSKARSAKPVSKNIRGLAWVGVKWAALVKPRILMLENVEEFCTWGPIDEETNRPCPIRSGETFEGFKLALSTGLDKKHPAWKDAYHSLFKFNTNIKEKLTIYKAIKHGGGYDVEFNELRACDYGTPTIRKRLFMIARCDGHKIVWPKPTHGDQDSKDVKKGKLKPYRSAAECIDWNIPIHSIFLTKEEAKKVRVKRPLADNTMQRIFKGLKKYVIDNDDPFLTEHANGSSQRVFDIKNPLRTQMASVKGGHFALVAPFISRQFGQSIGHSIKQPNGSITAGGGGKSSLVTCNLLQHYGGFYKGSGKDPRAPLSTITAHDHNALCTSHLIKMRNGNTGSSMREPIHTITSGGLHMGEVRAFLVKYYGNEKSGVNIKEPMNTVTTKDRLGLVTVEGSDYTIADIAMRMLQPRELFTAQGFPIDYIIDVGPNGKKATKQEQVARCGNAVPPQFSEALVRANLPEMCQKPQTKARISSNREQQQELNASG